MGFKAVLLSPAIVVDTGPATYPEAVAAIGTPILWYKFQGTSGTTAANSGSSGAGWNLTFDTSEYILGNTGQIGANEAIKNIAVIGSYIANYSASPAVSFASLTYMRLMYIPAASLTSGLMTIGSNSSNRVFFQDNSAGTMQFNVRSAGAASNKTTSVNFPRDAWFWSIGRWNGATGVSSLTWGYAGALSTPALSVDTSAALGAFNTTYAELELNRVNGLIDEVILWQNIVATDEQLLDIVTLSGL